jgi:hypothetical protein
MRVWIVALALLVGLCACGRYGPPVRSAQYGPAPLESEMPEDPNCKGAPESRP